MHSHPPAIPCYTTVSHDFLCRLMTSTVQAATSKHPNSGAPAVSVISTSLWGRDSTKPASVWCFKKENIISTISLKYVLQLWSKVVQLGMSKKRHMPGSSRLNLMECLRPSFEWIHTLEIINLIRSNILTLIIGKLSYTWTHEFGIKVYVAGLWVLESESVLNDELVHSATKCCNEAREMHSMRS